jgi:hypothetical protein
MIIDPAILDEVDPVAWITNLIDYVINDFW